MAGVQRNEAAADQESHQSKLYVPSQVETWGSICNGTDVHCGWAGGVPQVGMLQFWLKTKDEKSIGLLAKISGQWRT